MSKCVTCGGGTPAPLWKRCEPCAMIHLKFLMSGGRTKKPTIIVRKFARGDRVFVNGEINQPGQIVRVRDGQYTVKLDAGTRCYVLASDMRDINPIMRIRRATIPPAKADDESKTA